jgi:hypothetical protein
MEAIQRTKVPFQTPNIFLPRCASGVGAMELIALDLKRRGLYICRQLSFKAATFNTETIDLTPRQTNMYDQASAFWNEMLSCFNYAAFEVSALDCSERRCSPHCSHPALGLPYRMAVHPSHTTTARPSNPDIPFAQVLHVDDKMKKGHPASRVLSHYWGCHQRFFRAMCMAMKVPRVCEMAKQALADNKCVVIGLQVQQAAGTNQYVQPIS